MHYNPVLPLYGIKSNGDLHWYGHDGWEEGTADWFGGAGGYRIGDGWDMYDTVFGGRRGAIYGIKPNGDMHWYRHDGRENGAVLWTAGSGGNQIGEGWDMYDTVFYGGDSVIYGIKPNGDLHWYLHEGWEEGTADWIAGAGGNKIGEGWGIYDTVFCGEAGAIFGIKPNGDMYWYHHDGWSDGTARWTAGEGLKISGGWDIYNSVFGGYEGHIYGIKPNGDLQWYAYRGWQGEGDIKWTAGEGGLKVASGWDVYDTAFTGQLYYLPIEE
ncbi:tachylectin-related carbohydrate-binding protein [Streptomyces litmocidini]|uniref:Tachylectin-related carbohydrate-binding protein n=1 Tax=Streptomyces litmocidini TaxID=67318 RepID=A0ABW7TY08_9ACTN